MKKRELQIGDQLVKVPILQGGMGVGVSLSSLAGFCLRRCRCDFFCTDRISGTGF